MTASTNTVTYALKGDIRRSRVGDKTRIQREFNIAKGTNEVVDVDLVVANAASDLVIDLGGITAARMVVLMSDQTISVKVNGSGNTATFFKEIYAVSTGTGSGDEVTSLHLANASGSDACVSVLVVGSVAS